MSTTWEHLEGAAVTLVHVDSGKKHAPTFMKNGFCYYAAVPAGTYRLAEASIGTAAKVDLSGYATVVAVLENDATYAGSFKLTFRPAQEAQLEKLDVDAIAADRTRAQRYLDAKGFGWRFQ